MYTVYLDTSLVAKLILDEPDSDLVATWLTESPYRLVSSRLLETELRRAAAWAAVPQQHASTALSWVNLIDVPRDAFFGAGVYPDPGLRSLDALHVTMASLAGADAIATYDAKMAAAAQAIGLMVITPEAA